MGAQKKSGLIYIKKESTGQLLKMFSPKKLTIYSNSRFA